MVNATEVAVLENAIQRLEIVAVASIRYGRCLFTAGWNQVDGILSALLKKGCLPPGQRREPRDLTNPHEAKDNNVEEFLNI